MAALDVTVAFTKPGGANDFTANLPAGIAAGDLIILFLPGWQSGGGLVINTPSGYAADAQNGAAFGADNVHVFTKTATGGETTAAIDLANAAGSAICAAVRVEAGAIIANSGPAAATSGTTITGPAIDAAAGNLLLAFLVGESSGGAVFSSIESGWANEGSVEDAAWSIFSIGIGSKIAAGGSEDCAYTFSGALNPAAAFAIEIEGGESDHSAQLLMNVG